MSDLPFSFSIHEPDLIPSKYDTHNERRLSDLRGHFLEQSAYDALLAKQDPMLYEFYEIARPHTTGELLTGVSIVHPGKVGSEYFMTKGHFHSVLETAEVYYILKGQGYMVMETPEGEWNVTELAPGRVVYVPPRWAHRSVNTHPSEDLIFFFTYPGHAGHDYGSIERQGFRKLVIAGKNGPEIIENPRWLPPEARS